MCMIESDSSFYFTGTHAAGAGVNPAGGTIHHCLNTSDVGFPGTVGSTMRVGNLDAECNILTTNFAFCHCLHLLIRDKIVMQH